MKVVLISGIVYHARRYAQFNKSTWFSVKITIQQLRIPYPRRMIKPTKCLATSNVSLSNMFRQYSENKWKRRLIDNPTKMHQTAMTMCRRISVRQCWCVCVCVYLCMLRVLLIPAHLCHRLNGTPRGTGGKRCNCLLYTCARDSSHTGDRSALEPINIQ